MKKVLKHTAIMLVVGIILAIVQGFFDKSMFDHGFWAFFALLGFATPLVLAGLAIILTGVVIKIFKKNLDLKGFYAMAWIVFGLIWLMSFLGTIL
jgi:ABC-type dipeptide/oligopeptide/nickel transport system permease component